MLNSLIDFNTQALDNKYATVEALDMDVYGDKGKKAYDLKMRGDKSATGDAATVMFPDRLHTCTKSNTALEHFHDKAISSFGEQHQGIQWFHSQWS